MRWLFPTGGNWFARCGQPTNMRSSTVSTAFCPRFRARRSWPEDFRAREYGRSKLQLRDELLRHRPRSNVLIKWFKD
jgi:hypothetical protein